MMWLLQKKDKDENTGQTESEDRPVKSGDGAAREETPGIMGKECNLMTPLGWVQLKALRIAKNKHLKRTECTHKGFNSPLASSTHTYTLLLFPVPTYWSLLFLLAACSLQKKSTLFVPDSFFFLSLLLAVREMLLTSSEGNLEKHGPPLSISIIVVQELVQFCSKSPPSPVHVFMCACVFFVHWYWQLDCSHPKEEPFISTLANAPTHIMFQLSRATVFFSGSAS